MKLQLIHVDCGYNGNPMLRGMAAMLTAAREVMAPSAPEVLAPTPEETAAPAPLASEPISLTVGED